MNFGPIVPRGTISPPQAPQPRPSRPVTPLRWSLGASVFSPPSPSQKNQTPVYSIISNQRECLALFPRLMRTRIAKRRGKPRFGRSLTLPSVLPLLCDLCGLCAMLSPSACFAGSPPFTCPPYISPVSRDNWPLFRDTSSAAHCYGQVS